MVIVMEKNPLLHGLSCAKWQAHSCRPWRECLMHAYLRMGRGLLGINLMNLVLKILMEDMTVSEMVVVVVGGLVIMAKMEDELIDVVVAIEFILMMKNLITLVTKSGRMRIPLQMMGYIGGAMIIGGMLIMEIESIIMDVVIGKNQTTLLVSS